MPVEDPNQNASLQKRVRRRVTARSWDFFAATSPGLEKICRREFETYRFFKCPPNATVGGVEFSGRVQMAYRANLHARTAGRILMRVGGFKTTNFRGLKKKLENFHWELFLKPGSQVEFRVSSKHSRLYHTKAVEEHLAEAVEKWRGRPPAVSEASRAPVQKIYARIVEDRLVLSLDSSGENLYKRGLKTRGATAPLRETTAAAILMVSNYTGREPLIDPMCGSGTFSLEAAMVAQNIPAGWRREFAFFDWPCFSPGKWRHIGKKAREQIRTFKEPLIFASDIDSDVCSDLESCVKDAGFENAVQVEKGLDFFDFRPDQIAKKKGLVVLNPPYGCRMVPAGKDLVLFYKEIFGKLKADYKGWKAAVVVPDSKTADAAKFAWKKMPLFHGGLETYLLYGKVPG